MTSLTTVAIRVLFHIQNYQAPPPADVELLRQNVAPHVCTPDPAAMAHAVLHGEARQRGKTAAHGA